MKDFVGTVLSGACVVHCLLTPALLLLGYSGVLTFLAHSFELHLALYVSVTAMAVLSFPIAYKRHRKRMPMIMGCVGMVFLSLALMAESLYHLHTAETIMTILGGVFMIIAHVSNKRFLTFLPPPSTDG